NIIVALEDSRCNGNGSGCVAVVYGCESLMVDERGDSEDLQWARIVRIGESHADVPTCEVAVTHPATGHVDQLADIMSYDADLVTGEAHPGFRCEPLKSRACDAA